MRSSARVANSPADSDSPSESLAFNRQTCPIQATLFSCPLHPTPAFVLGYQGEILTPPWSPRPVYPLTAAPPGVRSALLFLGDFGWLDANKDLVHQELR
jgi:hypothetical protein